MKTRLLLGVVALAGLSGALSCGDPVHEGEVAALGPEVAGNPPGPLHRPGQPCLTCHGGLGPAQSTFVTAGTIYAAKYAAGTSVYAPLVGGDVHLVDAIGSTYDATTNLVGSFYVSPAQWDPVFPLGARSTDGAPNSPQENISVGPTLGSPMSVPMQSRIGRGGVYASCAYCHFDPPGPTSPGHVY